MRAPSPAVQEAVEEVEDVGAVLAVDAFAGAPMVPRVFRAHAERSRTSSIEAAPRILSAFLGMCEVISVLSSGS